MTADCLPILLSDEQGEVIAAIHGGWRPLALDIIKITLQKNANTIKQSVRMARTMHWSEPF
jgi:copper oxidase (laccase) domain-containing protein